MLVEKVIKPILAFALAAIIANCNESCLPFMGESISPAEAYSMEMSGCAQKYDAENTGCAVNAKDMKSYQDCHEDAVEHRRICTEQVDRKYFKYNSNGSYPTYPNPPPVR